MRHMAYFTMRKCLEKLSIQVPAIISELLGAYIWHEYNNHHIGHVESFWHPDWPELLRVYHLFDLGAGKFYFIL